ncbi:heavy metal-responsive transcriptional regulator [Pseudonocardia sp. RS11V-5]|uniref:heavy metal-responsive transcriptional regulator n=1 Tax=Pseudonocardia terrae TaxID=2905831 RepID=UPI001E60E790|nr:heavy metal-responsive transcriptional regulator [Pseudonocardia terrae]MCE3555975.1 heavy metal-responsive transcriptional regulator [Pseudonocardia terrae]
MRIGRLAAQTGVRVRTIRFYEQVGILPAPARTPGGFREYDVDAVARLRFARAAQALGLSLAQIAEILRLRDQQGPPCEHVVELLRDHIDAVELKIKELTALRDDLRARVPPGTTPTPSLCQPGQICYLIEGGAPEGSSDVEIDRSALRPESNTDRRA